MWRRVMALRWLGILALALLWWPAAARADLPGTPLPVCVARVRPGDTPARLFAPTAPLDCRAGQTRLGAGDFWARAASLAPLAAADSPLDIRFASLWQQRVTLWVHYADGKVATIPLGGVALTRHLRLGGLVVVRVPRRHAAVTGLLWRVIGSANLRGVLLGAALATPAESGRADLDLAVIYAGFGGLCLAMLVYNLALWAALRHRFQLAYCVMITALIAYAVSSSGLLAWLCPWMANNDRMRINYVTLAIAGSAALGFARSFLAAPVFAGWVGRAASTVSILLVASSLLYALMAPWMIGTLDTLYILSFLSLLAVVGPVLWRGWRCGDRYVWLFALAWGSPVLLALARVASGLRLIGWSLWLDHSTVISMALEALLSSLAIAYRIRLLSDERDAAREQEMAARLLADIDPLTALLNRRAFLREAIGRQGEWVLLLADIDHFKSVNDMLGHDGGDEVLRAVARALRRAAPTGALVARIGGEEFAVIAPSGNDLADVLLDAVRGQRMPFDVNVTVSIGQCVGPLAAEADWKSLYRQADGALFEAKRAGRDRARIACAAAAAA